ncbi:hypothetical protein [Gordonia aichiensis]|uniref:hypothetical protein n=1 Tax=Gordonia aichiensis TaxID=36820 RepID=UPI001FE10848|nr:hypothetical protein [Gordonia aichiensis]
MTDPSVRLASLRTDRGPVVLAAVPDGTEAEDILEISTDHTPDGHNLAFVPTPIFTEES